MIKRCRTRFLLYRRQILQGNIRWKALAEIYTMHSFAPFSIGNLKIFVKSAEMFANFCRIFATICRLSLNFAICWPIFAGIPPALRVVSNLVKIKCDLIFGCKIYFIFIVKC